MFIIKVIKQLLNWSNRNLYWQIKCKIIIGKQNSYFSTFKWSSRCVCYGIKCPQWTTFSPSDASSFPWHQMLRSVVDWLLIVQWVVGSIHHCALIELFLIPTSDQHLECYDYPICRIVHMKDPFLLIKRTQVEAVSSLAIQWSSTMSDTV